MKKLLVSWSGGKDACYALWQMRNSGFGGIRLLHMTEPEEASIRAHALPRKIIEAQAGALGLGITCIRSDWKQYAILFQQALKDSVRKGYTHIAYGDIALQEHRSWQEQECEKAGLVAEFPLWNKDRPTLVKEMIEADMCMKVISCQNKMGSSWLGRFLDLQAVKELMEMGIDPCGEEGEFHTLVTDGPMFRHPLRISTGTPWQQNNFCYLPVSVLAG